MPISCSYIELIYTQMRAFAGLSKIKQNFLDSIRCGYNGKCYENLTSFFIMKFINFATKMTM